MRNGMKKFFTVLLIVSVLMSMMSVSAFAEELQASRFDCDCETRHTHGNECWESRVICEKTQDLICVKEEHTHTEQCMVVHEHGDSCAAQPCGKEAGTSYPECGKDAYLHSETCYAEHVHGGDCYEAVLICEESVFHEHTSACFKKTNGKNWPNIGVCFELSCDYKDMKIHGHEYTCLTEAEKEDILNTYPVVSRTVPQFSEPYIFVEMQTYLPSGYYYHDPAAPDKLQPQLWMMGNVQGMKKGDIWENNVPETKRFVAGVSNFAAAYCCDADTDIKQYHTYRQVNLEDANYYDLETAKKIRSVMMNSYPWLSVEEMQERLSAAGFADAEEIDEDTLIAASQFAVWRYANADTDTIDKNHYWYTVASSRYPVLTAHWEKGGSHYYRPETNEQMLNVTDYLVDLAERAPEAAPESQIVVSQVEVTNLIMTPDENGTYTVDLQVVLNSEYDNSHEDTNIVIKAAAGQAEASVQADGSSVYNLKLEGYTEGDDITVTMSGTQHLPAGVYFYEPYVAPGQDVRKVAQNLVGINEGTVPVGDQVTLGGEKLATASLSLKKVNEDGKVLAGAQFELSYAGDEENIALGTYTSDADGEIRIEGLLAGKSYQLTETKAPRGYDAITGSIELTVGEGGDTILFNLPSGVTCATAEDQNYILTVVNCEKPQPPAPTYYTSVNVTKVWDDADNKDGIRPESISVQLLRNGKLYDTKVLSEGNWSASWTGLDDFYTWTVAEADVPEGYTSSVSGSGSSYTITNTHIPEEPPIVPEEPDDPLHDLDDGDVPQGGLEMDDPLYGLDEGDTPLGDLEMGDPNVPKTSDNSNMLLWLTLTVISLMALAGIKVAEKKRG